MKNGQIRTYINAVWPEIDNGRFPIKRVVGETVSVESDITADGHDIIRASLLFKHERQRKWSHVEMLHFDNDRYRASFTVEKQGFYEYRIVAWIDYAYTWRYGLKRKSEDGQDVSVELKDGLSYLFELESFVKTKEVPILRKAKKFFKGNDQHAAVEMALSDELGKLFEKYPNAPFTETYEHTLKVWVDRPKASFSTWYELFPRSASSIEGRHGTFQDVIRKLDRIAAFGFDTLYLPPIHPIGKVNRKGKNNSVTAEKGDVGSPWAIGSDLGGHKSIHPELGNMDDLVELIAEAEKRGIEIAMDIAYQCAPDHPYVKQHPEWFKWRADGTVQYAENPPKKYQDILPIYFESDDWEKLWRELTDVVLYWAKAGVRMFRVDNPHTKPYRFWEYLIREVQTKYPDAIFLSEAFTKPKVMHTLAKHGFTQSYTYFTWRTGKQELIDYMMELSADKTGAEYFRPNFWPNTPDINPYHLQSGLESLFLQRYFLSATLSGNCGIYGPVYELMEHEAVPGKEEYLDSEKYQLRHWDWETRNTVTHVITRVNESRKRHPSLQQTKNIHFCHIENEHILAYYKWDSRCEDHLLVVVNLDPYHRQEGWVQLPKHMLGVNEGHPLKMHDLMSTNSYIWESEWNYVGLEPSYPFHLFKIEK